MFPLFLIIILLPGLLFLHLVASFSPCKVILQVEFSRLEGCGLAVDMVRGFSLNPFSPQGLRPRGLLKLSVADVQHLLIE